MRKLSILITILLSVAKISSGQSIELPYQGATQIEMPGSDFVHFLYQGKMGLLDTANGNQELFKPQYDLIVSLPDGQFIVVEDGQMKVVLETARAKPLLIASKSLEYFVGVEGENVQLKADGRYYQMSYETNGSGFSWKEDEYGWGLGRPVIKTVRFSKDQFIVKTNNQRLSYLYDEYGDNSFDPETGEFLTDVTGGIYSGLYNTSLSAWNIKPSYEDLYEVDNGFVSEQMVFRPNEYGHSEGVGYGLIGKDFKVVFEPKTLESFTKEDSIALLPKGASIVESPDTEVTYFVLDGKMGVFNFNFSDQRIERELQAKFDFIARVSGIRSFLVLENGKFSYLPRSNWEN